MAPVVNSLQFHTLVAAFVSAHTLLIVGGLLLALNLQLAAGVFWPALWSLLVSAALWPVKEWAIATLLTAWQSHPLTVASTLLRVIRDGLSPVTSPLLWTCIQRLRRHGNGPFLCASCLQVACCVTRPVRPRSVSVEGGSSPRSTRTSSTSDTLSESNLVAMLARILEVPQEGGAASTLDACASPASRAAAAADAEEGGSSVQWLWSLLLIGFMPRLVSSCAWMLFQVRHTLLALAVLAAAMWAAYALALGLLHVVLRHPDWYAPIRLACRPVTALLCRRQGPATPVAATTVPVVTRSNAAGGCIPSLVTTCLLAAFVVVPIAATAGVTLAVGYEWMGVYHDVHHVASESATWVTALAADTPWMQTATATVTNLTRGDAFEAADTALTWVQINVSNHSMLATARTAVEIARSMSNHSSHAASSSQTLNASEADASPACTYSCNSSVCTLTCTQPTQVELQVPISCAFDDVSLSYAAEADLSTRVVAAWPLLLQAAQRMDWACVAPLLAAIRVDLQLLSSSVPVDAILEAGKWLQAAGGSTATWAAVLVSKSAQALNVAAEYILFLLFLSYLLARERRWLDDLAAAFLHSEHLREVTLHSITHELQQVFVTHAQVGTYIALSSYLLLTALGTHAPVTISLASAVAALLPTSSLTSVIIPIPSALELYYDAYMLWCADWPQHHRWVAAMCIAIGFWCAHFYLTFFIPYKFFEGKNAHPAVLGIAVVAGIASFGIQGIVLGPIIVSMLVVAFTVGMRVFRSVLDQQAAVDMQNVAVIDSSTPSLTPSSQVHRSQVASAATARPPGSSSMHERDVDEVGPATPPGDWLHKLRSTAPRTGRRARSAGPATEPPSTQTSVGAPMSPPPTLRMDSVARTTRKSAAATPGPAPSAIRARFEVDDER